MSDTDPYCEHPECHSRYTAQYAPMTDPTPRLCSSATNCLQWETRDDGSMVLWSSRRPEQRITLDADEAPAWRPAAGLHIERFGPDPVMTLGEDPPQ